MADDDPPPLEESNLVSLSYRELQQECRRRNLTAAGNAQKLRQRIRGSSRLRIILLGHSSEDDDNSDSDSDSDDSSISTPQPPKKKQKKDCPSKDLICPITRELPVDPVMAEDGITYERKAIEEHFWLNTDDNGMSRSPMTNTLMGQNLIPAIQMRNLIETLVKNGDLDEDLADSWESRVKDKEEMSSFLRKALAGDGDAALELGRASFRGTRGEEKNNVTAKRWFKKAAEAGNVKGMALAGYLHARDKEEVEATTLTAMAAGAGSDMACIRLARWYAKGRFGLAKNEAQAKYLLQRALNGHCSHKHTSDRLVAEGLELLQELEDAGDAGSGNSDDDADDEDVINMDNSDVSGAEEDEDDGQGQ